MSLPAIMKHLDVLSDAGLIAREKTGRTVACRLTAEPMEQAMEWLNRYQRFWSDALDRLAAFVEEDPWPPNQALSSQALPRLPSTPRERRSLTLKRRFNAAPEQVYAAWADPQRLSAMVRARIGRGRLGQGRYRSARRRPLPHQLQRQGLRITRSAASIARSFRTQRLVFSWAWHSTPERESLVTDVR